jgi:hypothetical protein
MNTTAAVPCRAGAPPNDVWTHYAKHIARKDVLALGIGIAAATTPAIAFADTSATHSTTSSGKGGSSATSTTSSSQPPTGSTPATVAVTSATSSSKLSHTGVADNSDNSTVPLAGAGARSSLPAQTPRPARHTPEALRTDPTINAPNLSVPTMSGLSVPTMSDLSAPTMSAFSGAAAQQRISAAADPSKASPTMQPNATDIQPISAVTNAPTPPDIVTAVGPVTSAISALRTSPSGSPTPTAPPQHPIMFAMLAWVRREFDNRPGTTTPTVDPVQTSQPAPSAMTAAVSDAKAAATRVGPVTVITPFYEDFSGPAGSAPNPAYWAIRHTGHNASDGTAKCTADNAFLDGQGHLVIQGNEQVTGNRITYTAGEVWTQGKINFGYGTLSAWDVSCRARSGITP